jgi:hypothetical protein
MIRVHATSWPRRGTQPHRYRDANFTADHDTVLIKDEKVPVLVSQKQWR